MMKRNSVSPLAKVLLNGLLVVGLFLIPLACGDESVPVHSSSDGDIELDFPDTMPTDGDEMDIVDDTIEAEDDTLDYEKTGRTIEVSDVLDFGYCMLWQCYEANLRIRSIGTDVLTIFSTVISQNSAANEFELENPIELEPVLLSPGQEYVLKVKYCPQDPGNDQGVLEITSNDDNRVRVQVALTSGYKGETNIQVAPLQINFGNVEVRSDERVCRMLSIRNQRRSGATDDNKVLTIFSVDLDDPNDVNFVMPNYTGSSILLPPDSATNIQVCCAPQTQGEHLNKLYIYHDADVCDSCTPNGDIEIPLSCNGVVPEILLTPSCSAEEPIDFGEVVVGSAVHMNVEIKNIGDANLEIYDISLTPQSSAAFYLNAFGLQNATISPGGRETFEITYSPTATTYDLGVLVVQSNAAENARIQCPIQGRGVISNISIDPQSLDFGDVLVGQTEQRTIKITNSGTATLVINDFHFEAFAEDYHLSANDRTRLPVTISSGDYEEFTIEYTPVEEANHATTMIIENNSSSPNLSVPVNGRGVSPHIVTSLWTDCEDSCDSCTTEVVDFEDIIDFGEVRLGDRGLRCLKVCNAGYAELVVTNMGLGPNTSADFRYFPEALPPMEHGTCKFVGLYYSPVLYPGPDDGSYYILSNDTDPAFQRLEYHLQGIAINPRINISPITSAAHPFDFGRIFKSAVSMPQTFEITNVGSGVLIISDIHKGFGNEENFTILKDGQPLEDCTNCLPVALGTYADTGESFTFEVVYSPKDQISSHSLTIIIENNDYGHEETPIFLRGAGKECDPPFFELDNCGPGSTDPNCPPDAQWCEYYCSDYPITPERCDYKDNDCNGQVDDGFPVGETCAGVGACPDGVWECDLRTGNVRCSTNPGGSAYQGGLEYCNNVDDDCNGEVDDGTYNYHGVPTNFRVGDPCIGIGQCGETVGVLECESLWTMRCSTEPGGSDDQSSPELCDGIDNNCNGETDEIQFPYTGNLEQYQNQSWHVGYPCNAGVGCGWGSFECDRNNPGGVICSTEPGGSQWEGSVEYCDGIDNNCNGQTDEEQYIYRGQWRYVGEACDGEGACGMGTLECDPRDPTHLICSTEPGGSEDESNVPELCDGIDNNCNGEIDEDFGIGDACQARCLSQTNGHCDCGWGTWECDPTDPRHRDVICSTDPGGSEYVAHAELCDGIDNDCDGSIDENFHIGEACVGQGECGIGFYECADQYTARCDVDYGGSHYQGQPEVCDGRDNDCDGSIDENFQIGQPCDGVGECGTGVFECNGLNDHRCSTEPGGSNDESQPEICDGKDNDCDGSIDEDFNVGMQCDGIGECGIGVFECNTTTDNRCSTEPGGSNDQSMPEICDGKDNDCDGSIDEDFDVFGNDIHNCGACGRECVCAHGTPYCDGGVCGCTCDAGWYDLNSDPSDGCECQADSNDPGNQCSMARQTSPFSLSDTGQRAIVSGKIVPQDDVDWYTFYAVDTPDTSCDKFHVRVRFLSNPGNQFAFAILRSSCSESGNNVLCSESTDFTYETDYSSTANSCIHGGGDGSRHYGECPCYAPTSSCPENPNYCSHSQGDRCCVNQSASCWPNITNACCKSSGGVNKCTDNSSTFYLKVFRVASSNATCEEYRIEISNALFHHN